MPVCLPQSDPDVNWPFCPSVIPAALFAALFGALTFFHLFQAIKYKKVYCWVIVFAALWQTAAYSIREYSVYNQKNSTVYSIWFILILTGPLWINAFIYMIVARMVWNFLPNRKLGGIKAWRFGTIFVLLDIVAFIVQAGGASMASGNDVSQKQLMLGLHIYMAGCGVQQFFIIIFFGLLVRFQIHYKRATPYPESNLPMRLLISLYIALGMITIRIIYRLIEYSSGFHSAIPTHEAFMYVFETIPMCIAILVLSVFHPGKVMPGSDSNIPGKKERKSMVHEGLLPGKKGVYENIKNTHSDTELGLVHDYPERAVTPPEHANPAPNYSAAQQYSSSPREYGASEGYEGYRHQ